MGYASGTGSSNVLKKMSLLPRTVRTWRGLRCVLRLWNVDPRRIDCALLSRSLSGLNNSLRESNNYNSLFTRESPATWRTYLSTNVGGDDGDNWYDMDTPEFVQIVKEHQAGGGNSLIVDVREPQELVESGQIPGTINIPRNAPCLSTQPVLLCFDLLPRTKVYTIFF